MQIIDAQVHIWEPSRPDRPWDVVLQPHGGGQFLAEQLLAAMDESGVDRAVLVPPTWLGYSNDYALEAAQRWPDRFAVMGRFDPSTPDAPARLTTWLDQPGMLGVRFVLAFEPWRRWLYDGTLDWFWPRAEELDIPVAVYAFDVLDEIDRIAARHPRLKLLVDHLALPVQPVDDPFATLGRTLALAKHPNVYAKASALPCYSREPYPFRDLHGHIRRVYEAFGPRRMLWGTDYTRLPCSYQEAVALISAACDFLDDGAKRWILGRATAEVLRWQLTETAVETH